MKLNLSPLTLGFPLIAITQKKKLVTIKKKRNLNSELERSGQYCRRVHFTDCYEVLAPEHGASGHECRAHGLTLRLTLEGERSS